MILSQLIRGAAEELISRPGELVDPVLVAAAMARAAERAYGSVREPAEGTILTVVREMAARVASELAHMDGAAAAAATSTTTQQDAMIAEVLERALDAGEQSVERGPELLPILREAGVVDAGGYGLTVDVRRRDRRAARHRAAASSRTTRRRAITHPQHESSTYRYCTNFAVTGEALDPAAWHRAARGARRLGAGRRRQPHAEGPRPHRRARARDGAVRRRRRGLAPRRRRHARAGRGARRAAGRRPQRRDLRRARRRLRRGHARAVRELGASPLDGGATLNPSTYELLAGIHDVPAEEVVVLPNSPERDHGRRARRRAVGEARPRRAVALAAGRPGRGGGARPDARRRRERRRDGRGARHVRTGAVTGAARDDAGRAASAAARPSASSTSSSSPGASRPKTLEAVLASSAARRSWSR